MMVMLINGDDMDDGDHNDDENDDDCADVDDDYVVDGDDDDGYDLVNGVDGGVRRIAMEWRISNL